MTKLEAIVQIDHMNFLLKKLYQELSTPPIQTSIEIMVDTACGYDRIKEIRDAIITCLQIKIEAKSALGLDCKNEHNMLKQINEI